MSEPKLLCESGEAALELRKRLGINQTVFWRHVGVTQSGGSRYESGRIVPAQVLWALHFVYGSEKEAQELLAQLRQPVTKETVTDEHDRTQ
ncbi:hypothetical protein BJN45_08680 [Azonexus hydrophilus]|uniref:RsaL-like HTH domain-containing protein n=1 Tax=Azonexus hydrophilus TaxID=418702 RepID=A0A1R1I9N0_9RHOO|nr:helix-turn-helix transcriptional regulator [Azonexus hydrophilus]OMG55299.1 hypothetical protein BJN45_08680 [Azonexus hydrophilus]